jgi:cell division protein FtsQ
VSGRRVQAQRLQSRGFGTSGLVAGLLFIVALVGVAWVYMGMVTLDRWPIRWLEVDGAFERVAAEQVRGRATPLVDRSYFTIDMEEVRDAVLELDWVSEVRVVKTWPDTVRLRVEEYLPVAHWTGGELIASTGEAFAVPGADEIQGLPWLAGPEGSLPEVIAQWQQFNNVLLPTGLQIDRISLDARGAWALRLDNGTEVALGREDAELRLRRLVSSLPELLRVAGRMPAGMDMRYSNGFAVRWPEPPPEEATAGGPDPEGRATEGGGAEQRG